MQIAGRHVLVTGGAGFIGSNLVDHLVANGARVRILDNLSTGTRANIEGALAGGAELQVGDVRSAADVAAAIDEVDIVMHLACSCLRVSLQRPRASHDVNAGGTLTVLEAAARAGVARFLYCSSSEAYGTAQMDVMAEDHLTQPTTVYGASKLAGEWYTLAYWRVHGLPVVIVRPFNTYGYREHVSGPSGEVIPKMTLRALAGQRPVILGDGRQTRDFTFVTDTVRGLLSAVECDALVGEIVNIASGSEVSIERVAELVCRACGSDCAPLYAPARPADVRRHRADVRKARGRLGFEPTVAIEEGIERYVAWFKEHHLDEIDRLLAHDKQRNWELAAPAGARGG
ncbi:MAG TPA: NAD-dependent epimerase/dehydratase family protein [Solirubrobacteraceae bacterium]|nr:NAD-dependent epimerase/dehydratase family protein [Solirubrobacteraceae bacterium]